MGSELFMSNLKLEEALHRPASEYFADALVSCDGDGLVGGWGEVAGFYDREFGRVGGFRVVVPRERGATSAAMMVAY